MQRGFHFFVGTLILKVFTSPLGITKFLFENKIHWFRKMLENSVRTLNTDMTRLNRSEMILQSLDRYTF